MATAHQTSLPLSLVRAVACAAALTVSLVAHAGIVGSTVTGDMYVTSYSPGIFLPTNYFDPASGYVPAGYSNSASPTAVVGSGGVEYAFINGGGSVASPGISSVLTTLTSSSIVVTMTDDYGGGLTGFQVVLTDPAFTGLTFSKTSDGFANGGFATSLVGDQLTLTVGADCLLGSGCSWAHVNTATWSISGTPVPLPASSGLLLSGAIGLMGLGLVRRRETARVA